MTDLIQIMKVIFLITQLVQMQPSPVMGSATLQFAKQLEEDCGVVLEKDTHHGNV